MKKKRILWCGEFTELSTGYAVLGKSLLKHLHETGKFEIAELACYCSPNDPRQSLVPWKVYPVLPNENNPQEVAVYNSQPDNQFGAWKFEEVCLDFQCNFCIDGRDTWMNSYQEFSPFRKNYNWTIMPTVDGIPQHEDWIASYTNADAVFAYTDWSLDVLKKEGKGKIKTQCATPAGVELDIFKPTKNKTEHKRMFGFRDDIFIVGCFAKDTPVLMSDFSYKNIQDVQVGDLVIDAEGNEQIVENTYIFDNNKKMLEIDVTGEPENIVLTEDHEILSVKRENVKYCQYKNGNINIMTPYCKNFKEDKYNWTPSFNEPKNLNKSDYWAFKIPNKIIDIEEINVSDYVDNSINGRGIPAKIKIDEDFLWLAGFYLGNGSIASSPDCPNHSVSLVFNQDAIENQDKTIHICKKLFNYQAKKRLPKNCYTTIIDVNNVYIARLFAFLFGKYAGKKKIPAFINYLPPTKQLALVRGWQAADGHETKDYRNMGVTINKEIAFKMKLFLLRNGIICSINKPDMNLQKGFDNAQQQWRVVEKLKNDRGEQFIYNGYLYCRIREIKEAKNHEKVYDLTVSNSHSYTVYCKGVHNTCQRNQMRKLYPDLFESFVQFLKEAPHLAQKTFLYVHSAYPDIGWDFPRLLKHYGITHKVLFTYCCFKCGLVFPQLYQDVRTTCPKCKGQDCTFPNTQRGIDRQSLAHIYNLFDVFVQYSVCEGQGIPQVEAAACGVPVMSVDYSAMTDVVRKVNGYPIKVQRMFWDVHTGRQMALPDNSDLVNKLINFLQLPETMRAKKGFDARKGAEKHYSWPVICKRWEDYFDSTDVRPPAQTWASRPHVHSPSQQIPGPDQLTDEQFVNWAIVNVWGRPEYLNSYIALKTMRDLTWGVSSPGVGGFMFNDLSLLGSKPTYQEYKREHVVKQFTSLCEKSNFWEQKRWQRVLAGGIRSD